ncbi:hypothetical protein F5883DRAFT_695428 [Diaporthe sp. PMI_573]|nr:hypothetical protein F5883DRAFT_695428 [Diaporthaceae sp. PMI_573]
MKTVMTGPFGQEMDLGLFGTVLLFATGISIAAQLPYVSQLLTDYQADETRRIALFWQVDSEAQTAWVADQMQYLLRLDVEKILDIRLFVVGAILSETTRRGDHMKLGERIDLTYDFMDAEDLIGAEMDGRKGRIVVSPKSARPPGAALEIVFI